MEFLMWITNPSLSELTLIIFDIELTHWVSEASEYVNKINYLIETGSHPSNAVREYKGYVAAYNSRSDSTKWCHQHRPNDCLETVG